jgi:hypothetical protein
MFSFFFFTVRICITSPSTQGGGPHLDGCPRLLIQYIPSYPPYMAVFSSIPKLRTRHKKCFSALKGPDRIWGDQSTSYLMGRRSPSSGIIWRQYEAGGRDSVVGITTRYGLEGPGIESRTGEIFRTYPDRLRGPPSLLYNRYRVFPGGKGGRGVMLTTQPILVPRLRKSWAIPPLALWVLLGL